LQEDARITDELERLKAEMGRRDSD
jgi:hypothetical protein